MTELLSRLQQLKTDALASKPTVAGKLTRVVGLTLEAVGCRAAIGSLCSVETDNGLMDAEVVGFDGD